jgi:hypothetical protein
MPDWSDDEDRRIRERYRDLGADACLSVLTDRTRGAIQHRAHELGETTPKLSSDLPWDADEDQVIRQHYPDAGSDLEDMLPGRTRRAIKERAHRLGITYAGLPRGLRQFE